MRDRSSPAASLAAVALAAVSILLLTSSSASADVTRAQCIDANAKAQDLRRDRKLSLAREALRACADAACPAMVRSDCTKRLDELEAAQPTVVFEVKDASGADVVAVKVTVDGTPVSRAQDGTPVPLDPGQHVVTFEASGFPSVTRTLILVEGVKGRREHVVLEPASGAPVQAQLSTIPVPRTESSTTGSNEDRGHGRGTQKILGLTFAGAGVVGVVVGSVFGAMTLSKKSDQENVCGSACTAGPYAQAASDHSTGITDSTVSTVAFIAGGALLAGGAVLFFTVPRSSSQSSATTGLRIVPNVGPGGGGMLMTGEF